MQGEPWGNKLSVNSCTSSCPPKKNSAQPKGEKKIALFPSFSLSKKIMVHSNTMVLSHLLSSPAAHTPPAWTFCYNSLAEFGKLLPHPIRSNRQGVKVMCHELLYHVRDVWFSPRLPLAVQSSDNGEPGQSLRCAS